MRAPTARSGVSIMLMPTTAGRCLRDLIGHEPGDAAERDHDEGEFAGLGEQDRGLDRHAQRHAEQRGMRP